MSGGRWRRTWVLVWATSLVLAVAAPGLAQDLYSAVAQARGSALPVHQASAGVAARSAKAQAAAGSLFHTDLSSLLGGCSSAAETVGRGPDVPSIFEAFRQSSQHWGIITSSRWTAVGAGQAVGADGLLYVSIVFCETSASSQPSPAPSPVSGGGATGTAPVSTASAAPATLAAASSPSIRPGRLWLAEPQLLTSIGWASPVVYVMAGFLVS